MSKRKKNKKSFKGHLVFLLCGIILLVIWAGFGLFFLLNEAPASIYVYPENPKQGDTVFIRVKTDAEDLTGSFDKEKLTFYKKGGFGEWIAFLGVDAEHEPGDYTIFVHTAKAEHLAKAIKVEMAGFSSEKPALAPKNNQAGISNQKAVANIRGKDNPSLQKILSNFTDKAYFTSAFSFPLNNMQQAGFPFGKYIGFDQYKIQHLGVDLRAPKQTDIYVINNGRVVATLELSNYGKTIIIDHGLDIFSLYLHLDQFKVSEGQMVSRGQTIGLSGDTGYVTAPHLHFSIRVGGARVDPVVFIQTSKKMNNNFILADLLDGFINFIGKRFNH